MTNGLIAIDIGGTNIKACLICQSAMIIEETVAMYDSNAKGSAENILNQFMMVITDQVKKAKAFDVNLLGIGFAFPGPFDYDNGISLIKGLDKYDAIYQTNLKKFFNKQIGEKIELKSQFTPEFTIYFKHDADSFAIGECHYGLTKSFERVICLTLGTGVGSSFIQNGYIVNNQIPLDGRIYLSPYLDGFAEDFISRRGINRIAASLGWNTINLDVIDIAQLAFQGDFLSMKVFQRFGEILGDVLEPFINFFKPNAIVFGGQISKSSNLFLPYLKEQLDKHTNIHFKVSQNSLYSTWRGIYHQYFNTVNFSI